MSTGIGESQQPLDSLGLVFKVITACYITNTRPQIKNLLVSLLNLQISSSQQKYNNFISHTFCSRSNRSFSTKCTPKLRFFGIWSTFSYQKNVITCSLNWPLYTKIKLWQKMNARAVYINVSTINRRLTKHMDSCSCLPFITDGACDLTTFHAFLPWRLITCRVCGKR